MVFDPQGCLLTMVQRASVYPIEKLFCVQDIADLYLSRCAIAFYGSLGASHNNPIDLKCHILPLEVRLDGHK